MTSCNSTEGAGVTQPLRVGIVGFGETKAEAPYLDESWTLWGMNGLWRVLPRDVPEERFGAWFEIHTDEYLKWHSEASKIGDQQFEWLRRRHPFPVFMQDVHPDYPSSVKYPLEALIAEFGDYFTSSVAYGLALALIQNPAEIGLWGIDLVHGTEWADQRPCAEWWMGIAQGRKIPVTVPTGSALLKQRNRYGYDDNNEALKLIAELRKGLLSRAEDLRKGVVDAQRRNDDAVREMQTNDGAHQAVRELLGRLEIWERGGRI